jgi:hypothetical protein
VIGRGSEQTSIPAIKVDRVPASSLCDAYVMETAPHCSAIAHHIVACVVSQIESISRHSSDW